MTFNGSGSDPDGQTLIFSWSFGDGATALGASAAHVYSAANTYTATLTVSDGQLSATSSTTAQIAAVVQTNHPPTAHANDPQAGATGIGVSFDGSGSTDPDNDALSYAWTYGDGTSGTDQKPLHVYAAAGSFTVTLTVTDTHGASDVATTSATITAAADRSPPIVVLAGPKEALPGAHVTMVADASDNIGVTSVTLDINGADPIQYLRAAVPARRHRAGLRRAGHALKIGATARDAAGNSSTASAMLAVVAEPDTVKPLVTMRAPSAGGARHPAAVERDGIGQRRRRRGGAGANGTTLATLTVAALRSTLCHPRRYAGGVLDHVLRAGHRHVRQPGRQQRVRLDCAGAR